MGSVPAEGSRPRQTQASLPISLCSSTTVSLRRSRALMRCAWPFTTWPLAPSSSAACGTAHSRAGRHHRSGGNGHRRLRRANLVATLPPVLTAPSAAPVLIQSLACGPGGAGCHRHSSGRRRRCGPGPGRAQSAVGDYGQLAHAGSFASGRSPVSRVARKRYVSRGGTRCDFTAAIQDQAGSGYVPRAARCVAVAVHGSSGHGWRG